MFFQNTHRSISSETSAPSRQALTNDRRAESAFAERLVFEGRHHRSEQPTQNDTDRSFSSEEPGQETVFTEIATADELFRSDHFEFASDLARMTPPSEGRESAERATEGDSVPVASLDDGARPDPDPDPDPTPPQDNDPDPAPPPVDQPPEPAAPTNGGRPAGTVPETPQVTPPAPPPGDDNADYGSCLLYTSDAADE